MRRILQTLLLFGCCVPYGYAASFVHFGQVSGQVNGDLGVPLAGATVLISNSFDFSNSLLTAVTNKAGEFQLANLKPGEYAVQVTQNGYRPYVKAPVQVTAGSTTKLVLILQDLLALGKTDDPANWDFRTVLRSSRRKRLIFRGFDSQSIEEKEVRSAAVPNADLFGTADKTSQEFVRSAAMEVYTAGAVESEDYYAMPDRAGGGLRTNFGYSMPIGDDARYVLAGQVNSGYDSIWKIRNQVDLKLNDFQVWTFSVNYGRLGFPAARLATLLNPNNLSNDTAYVHDRGRFQTLTVGVESFNKLLSPITLIYGLDLTVLKGPGVTSFTSPHLQVVVQPNDRMSIRAMVANKRTTESDSVGLSDGEMVSLSNPFRVSQVGSSFSYGRTTHYELGIARKLPSNTMFEIGAYGDRNGGSPVPLMAIVQSPTGSSTHSFSLSRNQSNAEGIRLLVTKRFWDFLSGSMAYVYGSGATISGIDILGTNDIRGVGITKGLFHSLTTEVDADVERTKTHLSTLFRWVHGSPITTLDSFSDYYGMGNGNLRITIRQVIPVPNLLGMSGRWEALLDMRNLLEIDDNRFPLPQGNLFVVRNPRFIRLGIAFRM